MLRPSTATSCSSKMPTTSRGNSSPKKTGAVTPKPLTPLVEFLQVMALSRSNSQSPRPSSPTPPPSQPPLRSLSFSMSSSSSPRRPAIRKDELLELARRMNESNRMMADPDAGGRPVSVPNPIIVSPVTSETVPYSVFEKVIKRLVVERTDYDATLKRVSDDARSKELELHQLLQGAQERAEDGEKQIKRLTEEIERLHNRVIEVERDMKSTQLRLEEEVRMSVEVLHSKAMLEEALDDSKAENGSLVMQLNAYKKKYDDSNGDMKRMKLEEEAWKRCQASQQLAMAQLQSNLEMSRAQHAESEHHVEMLNDKLSGLESQLVLSNSQMIALTQKLDSHKQQQQQLMTSSSSLVITSQQLINQGKQLKKTQQSESPPMGENVSIVFTDVEQSTALWEARPDSMRLALDAHYRVLRDKVVTLGGYEVKSEGDSLMVAFQSAQQAVRWSLAVHESLLMVDWSPLILEHTATGEVYSNNGALVFRGLRVRIGIHCGPVHCTPDGITGRMDYFGPTVNRAARITALARGGETVISASVWKDVATETVLFSHKHLGGFHLKGFEDTETLTQILPLTLKDRSSVFPPMTSPVTSSENTSFERETSSLLLKKKIQVCNQSGVTGTPIRRVDMDLVLPPEISTILRFLQDWTNRLPTAGQKKGMAAMEAISSLRSKNLRFLELVEQLRINRQELTKTLSDVKMEKTQAQHRANELAEKLRLMEDVSKGVLFPVATLQQQPSEEMKRLREDVREKSDKIVAIMNELMHVKEENKKLSKEVSEKCVQLKQEQSEKRQMAKIQLQTTEQQQQTSKQTTTAVLMKLPERSKLEALIMSQAQLLAMREHREELEVELMREKDAKQALIKHLLSLHELLPQSKSLSMSLVAHEGGEEGSVLQNSLFNSNNPIVLSSSTHNRHVVNSVVSQAPDSSAIVLLLQGKIKWLESTVEKVSRDADVLREKDDRELGELRQQMREMENMLVAMKVERDQLITQLTSAKVFNIEGKEDDEEEEQEKSSFELAEGNLMLGKKLREAMDTIVDQARQIAELQSKVTMSPLMTPRTRRLMIAGTKHRHSNSAMMSSSSTPQLVTAAAAAAVNKEVPERLHSPPSVLFGNKEHPQHHSTTQND